MTFEEALEFKKTINPEDYINSGIVPVIFVVPKDVNNFSKYILEFYYNPKSDDRAKAFDEYNSFEVAAIYIYTEGTGFYKILTSQ